ncbi:MAG: type II secretion system protein M [Gallionella sp.]|jgi:type II secretory pathway component PulM|nr:type II secretion system protein M [Gallionella sp.]
MKVKLQKFREDHWEKRGKRERQMILLASAIAGPLLIYLLLWEPSHRAIATLNSQLPDLRLQTAQMRTAAQNMKELRHRPQPAVIDAGAVKAAVEESLARHQLRDAITSVDLLEPNGVRIASPGMPFNKWMAWLRALEQEQHIRVELASVSPLPESGFVAVRATLVNGSAQ